jgi:hypothetical protein
MNWFRNLKVGNKLLVSFMVILVAAIIAGGYALINMNNINTDYANAMGLTTRRVTYIMNAKDGFATVRSLVRELYLPGNSIEDIHALNARIDTRLAETSEALQNLSEVAALPVKEKVATIIPRLTQ